MPTSRHYIDKTAIIGGSPQHFKGYTNEIVPVIGNPVWIGPFTTVDAGTERATTVGDGTMIMGHCNIGHDAMIGEGCDVADSVVVAGHVEIEDNVRIGIGAMLLPYVRVARFARVGAGAVVTKDVAEYTCVFGNPARLAYYLCRCGCGEREGSHE